MLNPVDVNLCQKKFRLRTESSPYDETDTQPECSNKQMGESL
jgi:hypothetical protein